MYIDYTQSETVYNQHPFLLYFLPGLRSGTLPFRHNSLLLFSPSDMNAAATLLFCQYYLHPSGQRINRATNITLAPFLE